MNRWPTTAHSPRRWISSIQPVGALGAQELSCAVPAGASADQAGDDRRADCRTQGDEQAENGPEQHTAARSQNRAGHEDRAERRRHHDVGQRRGGTGGGNRAPDIVHVDHPRDRHQIEQPEQERREDGEPHDVASSGGGGEPSSVGHAGRDSSARRVGSVAMTGDDRVRLSGSPDGVPRISPREGRFVNRSRNL